LEQQRHQKIRLGLLPQKNRIDEKEIQQLGMYKLSDMDATLRPNDNGGNNNRAEQNATEQSRANMINISKQTVINTLPVWCRKFKSHIPNQANTHRKEKNVKYIQKVEKVPARARNQ